MRLLVVFDEEMGEDDFERWRKAALSLKNVKDVKALCSSCNSAFEERTKTVALKNELFAFLEGRLEQVRNDRR